MRGFMTGGRQYTRTLVVAGGAVIASSMAYSYCTRRISRAAITVVLCRGGLVFGDIPREEATIVTTAIRGHVLDIVDIATEALTEEGRM